MSKVYFLTVIFFVFLASSCGPNESESKPSAALYGRNCALLYDSPGKKNILTYACLGKDGHISLLGDSFVGKISSFILGSKVKARFCTGLNGKGKCFNARSGKGYVGKEWDNKIYDMTLSWK